MKQPIQLTAEQIQTLFDFTTKKYVKYIDVQYELVDHLASSIEVQMLANPEIGFASALDVEYGKFPITGFYQFAKQKHITLQKYWQRKMWSVIKRYFRSPQLLMTILIFFAAFSFYTNYRIEITKTAGHIIYLASTLYYAIKSHRNKTNYLFIKQFYIALSAIPILAFPFLYFSHFTPNGVAALFYATGISLTIIFLVGAFSGQFQKLLEEEIQTKYAHLQIIN